MIPEDKFKQAVSTICVAAYAAPANITNTALQKQLRESRDIIEQVYKEYRKLLKEKK